MNPQVQEEAGKKKSGKQILAIVIIIVAALVFFGYYFLNAYVTVNGKEISLTQQSDMESELAKQIYKEGYVFTDPDMEKACVTYDFDLSDIKSDAFVISALQHKSYNADFNAKVDKKKLADYIDKWNETATKSKNATIDADWNITEAVNGTVIDKKALLAAVSDDSTGINPADYYVKPEVTTEQLKAAKKKAQEYLDWKVTYTKGVTVTVPKKAITISKTGEVKVDDSYLEKEVEKVNEKYNTLGKPVSFKTHGGKTIKLSSLYWGNKMDTTRELTYLKNCLKKGKSVSDRKPELTGHGGAIGDSYCEVSISAQHVWVYKNGKMIMDSACVTGRSGGRDTPTGIYYLLEKKPGKDLKGDDYVTPVHRWMRITWTGVGFHDAYWRSSFGGNIYISNGSHGCVNLPSAFAYKMYDVVYVGMPVAIY